MIRTSLKLMRKIITTARAMKRQAAQPMGPEINRKMFIVTHLQEKATRPGHRSRGWLTTAAKALYLIHS